MKLYEIVIKPTAPFGTPLKGDTIFGHFCWQAAYDDNLLDGGLAKWVDRYGSHPFAVFSSAWPRLPAGDIRYAVKKPDLPQSLISGGQKVRDRKTSILERKKIARKRWLLVDENLTISLDERNLASDEDLLKIMEKRGGVEARRRRKEESALFVKDFLQPHNTINRLTMTTGEGMFAPFEEPVSVYAPGVELAVFTLIDPEATSIERVVKGMERIGQWGFGRNASTGLGRFQVLSWREIQIRNPKSSNAVYTLAPCVPQKNTFAESYFTPFVRYGKHGDALGRSGNPFKNPVIMADEGAVFVGDPDKMPAKPYIGSAVKNVSKAMPQSISQGYSVHLPLRLEI